MNRFGNVLKFVMAIVCEGKVKLASSLPHHVIGDANTAGLSYRLQAGRHVNSIAVDVTAIDDDVAKVYSNTKPKLTILLVGLLVLGVDQISGLNWLKKGFGVLTGKPRISWYQSQTDFSAFQEDTERLEMETQIARLSEENRQLRRLLESEIDPRFGRCRCFLIVDPDTLKFEALDNAGIAASGGAGIAAAQAVINRGVEAVITGNLGPNSHQVLSRAGIKVFTGSSGKVRDVLEKFKAVGLKETSGPTVAAHAGMTAPPK